MTPNWSATGGVHEQAVLPDLNVLNFSLITTTATRHSQFTQKNLATGSPFSISRPFERCFSLMQKLLSTVYRGKRRQSGEGTETEGDDGTGVPAPEPSGETPNKRMRHAGGLDTQKTVPKSGVRHGMFTLVDQPRDAPDVVDIIALHGLNGHYYYTWSGKYEQTGQPYNWLEKDLSAQHPNARVLSYGYDSAIFSKSIADITTFADQLLEALLTARSSSPEGKRPLIFICHSLGGIVFKKVS